MSDTLPTHQENEHASSPHTFKNRMLRVIWGIVQLTLFRTSPRPFHRWRIMLLKLFGADVTMKSRVYPRAKIWAPWNLSMADFATIGDDVDCYCVERIRIGERSTISQYSYLCGATHDYENKDLPLIPKPITIGADVWITADVFVAPGVTIHDGVVVGARSSVFHDLPQWTVYAGTPAKPIGPRTIKDDQRGVES